MDEETLLQLFHGWLKNRTEAPVVQHEGRETFEQGYRQGYRHSSQDILEEFEDRAFEEGVDLE